MLIKLENISKSYSNEQFTFNALMDVNIEIDSSETVAIMGPSGSGKSTLMNIIGLLDTPSNGRYFLKGEPVDQMSDSKLSQLRNKEIGFVFQSFNLLPKLTVLENIILPTTYTNSIDFNPKTRALEIMSMVGIESKQNNYPNQLSGGQTQRVAIARSLINKPSIIMADEPTGNLDSKTSLEIIDLFKKLNSDYKTTVIIITHEELLGNELNRIIYLKDGKVEKDERKV